MTNAKLVRRFSRERDGNITILSAVSFIALLSAVGVAVDGTRILMAKSEFQRAADAAGLAIGTVYESDEQLKTLATRFMNENFDMPGATIASVDVTSTSTDVYVTATLEVDTYFVDIFTDVTPRVSVETDVRRAGGGLMVSLVLDNTGSMWSGLNGTTRIEALRAASHSMTDAVFGDKTVEENLRVSVVPYAAVVNVGDEAWNVVKWMGSGDFKVTDPDGLSGVHKNHLPQLTYDPSDPAQWKGCVFERPGANSLSDAPPGDAAPKGEEWWKPFIWPISKDNNYGIMSTGPGNQYEIDPDKVDPGGDRSTNAFHGPNVGCPTPILPLTKKKADVTDALDAMTAWNRGGTIADIGMAWGLRTLTPGEPFTQSDTEVDPLTAEKIWESDRWRRAIVLMTDGDNLVYNAPHRPKRNKPGDNGKEDRVQSGSEESDLTAYGRLGDAQFRQTIDTKNAGTAKTRIEQRLAALCTSIKAQDIVIYTVVFSKAPSQSTKDLYQGCASDPGKYWFAPSAGALDNAFGAIGSDLNKLRITR